MSSSQHEKTTPDVNEGGAPDTRPADAAPAEPATSGHSAADTQVQRNREDESPS